MVVRIECRSADGICAMDVYGTREEAAVALNARLAEHRSLGHLIVSDRQNQYAVATAGGELLARYRVLYPAAEGWFHARIPPPPD
jgi:hypothetical protein